ncbi:uncharacterized protein LOC131953803 isoform X1 [Physella acuta]|uniref:uncharacterized protein LOC131953803 isoform X1 n=1 Tax=Physella acuta TaxID=109671 RepID=UPI0027DDB5E1|nr:uncharacterized protein LOC131953803 isoform X1 [Physella acuta]
MSVLFKFCVACIASVILAGKQNEVPKNNCEKEADCFLKNFPLHNSDPMKFDSKKYAETCDAKNNLKTCLKNIKNKCKTEEWQEKLDKMSEAETFVFDLCSQSGNAAYIQLYATKCLDNPHSVMYTITNCTTEMDTCFRSDNSFSLRCFRGQFKDCVADSLLEKCGLTAANLFGDIISIYFMIGEIDSEYSNVISK